jgi:peptide/nickel transport system substrate-binding protein
MTGPQSGGDLRFVTRDIGQTRTLDSTYRRAYIEYFMDFAIYDNLVELGSDGSIQASLAETWEIAPDGRSVTFNLIGGAQFTDGTPLNAEAVKYNIDRAIDPEVQSSARVNLLVVNSAEVLDSDTVRLNLDSPWRPLLADLTNQAGWVASPDAIQKTNSYSDPTGNFGKNPVATGPFKLREWRPGDRIVVERNDNYWDAGKPYLDSILFFSAPQEVRVAMIRTGEADVMSVDTWGARDLALLENNPNVVISGGPSSRHIYLELDTNWGPLQDKKVRHAISFALDRQTMVDNLLAGKGRTAHGPEGGGLWWEYPREEFQQMVRYDPARARTLLAEAGYSNGLTLPMWCRSDSSAERTYCETLQAMLGAVGIDLELTLVRYADVVVARNNGQVRIETLGFFPRGDPHGRFGAVFHTKGWGNFAKYVNPDVDRRIEEAATIFDQAEAKAKYLELYRIVMDDMPRVFWAEPDRFFLTRSNVKGFVDRADTIDRVHELWIEK